MDFICFTACKNDGNRRFDRVVRRIIEKESLSLIYKNIRKGLILLNGKKASPKKFVSEGDSITIASFLLEGKTDVQKPETVADINFPKQILFRNEHLLIINKPYDISVQGNKSIASELVLWYQNPLNNNAPSLSFRPGPLHRLDRRTTGLLTCSLSLTGAQWFSENIAAHTIKKTYIAIVQGHLAHEELWDDSIERKDSSAVFSTVTVHISGYTHGQTKEALTKAIPLAYGLYKNAPVTLVKFKITTGRKHQIRAQSAAHLYPLLGDTAYGGYFIDESQQLYLHAYLIDIPENKIGLPLTVIAPIPTNFKKMLSRLLIDWHE